jgi:apolipoprotein D and lipocalin family protein
MKLLFLALLAAASLQAQTVAAVPKLDETRLTGTWYEIARLPDRHEKACIADAFELVTRGDKLNQLQVVDSCKTKKAYTNVRNFNANPQDKKSKLAGDGRLKVPTIWPFAAKRWVLATGPNFEWWLVGNPNHKSLWIFARTPALAPDVLASIKTQASSEGYAVDHLVMTPQSVPVSAQPLVAGK